MASLGSIFAAAQAEDTGALPAEDPVIPTVSGAIPSRSPHDAGPIAEGQLEAELVSEAEAFHKALASNQELAVWLQEGYDAAALPRGGQGTQAANLQQIDAALGEADEPLWKNPWLWAAAGVTGYLLWKRREGQ